MDKVQRRERTEHPGLKEEHKPYKSPDVVLHAPRSQQSEWHDERRQQNHQQPQAINSQEVFDVQRRNPRVTLDKLKFAGLRVEVQPQNHDRRKSQAVETQPKPLRQGATLRLYARDERGADQRREGEKREPGDAVHLHPQMKNSAPMVSARPRTRR